MLIGIFKMDNIIVNNNPGFPCILWITDSMKTFVENFKSNHCRFSVSLVPAGYYASWEEASGGSFGYIGPMDPNHIKTNFPENMVTLRCCLKLSSLAKSYIDELKNLAENMDTTSGGRNQRLYPLIIETIYKYEQKTNVTYVCKNKGFDLAFESLKVLMPSLTEKEFATFNNDDEYNTNLIHYTNVLDKHDLLIETLEKVVTEKVGIDYYNMSLEVISTDITKNTELMEKILTLAETLV